MKTENQATTGTQPKISDGNSDLFVFDCIHLFGGACLLKISERDSHPFPKFKRRSLLLSVNRT